MVPVPDRSAKTLVPIIKQAVPDDGIVRSDGLKAYLGINATHRIHLTVNHKTHFVDPETWAHIQRIESLWNQCKLWKQNRYYRDQAHLDRYVKEWCYRYNMNRDFRKIWLSLYW